MSYSMKSPPVTPGYIADGREPRLPPGMKAHLHEDLNKGFDF
jgi:hypothetical protein